MFRDGCDMKLYTSQNSLEHFVLIESNKELAQLTKKSQLEDPFVLRKALDVTRSQLWAIQERLDLQGEGGQNRCKRFSKIPKLSLREAIIREKKDFL